MHDKVTRDLFGPHGYRGEAWAMTFAEKFAISGVLQTRRPDVSLEVGTLEGGSLSIASRYSTRVISIDPDPGVRKKLSGKFENVEFVTGYSQEALSEILEGIEERGEDLGYVLIDGDHTEEGVKRDIEAVLKYRPRSTMWLLMHDSFNPDCRRGMKSINWEAHRHVHWINYDFIPGFLSSLPGREDQMWCGMALAYLEARPREKALVYGELLGRQFGKLLPLSAHDSNP